MKVTAAKKLVVEDYPPVNRDVVQRLAAVMNPVFDQVTQALSGNLTLADNFKGKRYTISLPAGTSTYRVAWELNEKPTAVYIGSLAKSTGLAPSAVFCLHWRYEDKALVLTFLGLDAGTNHTTTIVGII